MKKPFLFFLRKIRFRIFQAALQGSQYIRDQDRNTICAKYHRISRPPLQDRPLGYDNDDARSFDKHPSRHFRDSMLIAYSKHKYTVRCSSHKTYFSRRRSKTFSRSASSIVVARVSCTSNATLRAPTQSSRWRDVVDEP